MASYHEMTMNEPHNSPARRKQHLVICLIMTGVVIHSALDAGILAPLDISQNTFPGGTFVYKSMRKDYAASSGTLRVVASDLGIGGEEGMPRERLYQEEEPEELVQRSKGDDDLLYTVFMDHERLVPGGKTRYAGGALLTGKSRDKDNAMKENLLGMNERIALQTVEEGVIMSKHVQYQVGSLPKVEAVVASHPFTGGAWSSILQSYKIFPKLKAYVDKENGESGKSPVMIATCSAKQKMCTYYSPLTKRDEFFMGKKTTEEYVKEFSHVGVLERMGFDFDLGNVFQGLRRAMGYGGKSSTRIVSKVEL